MSDFDFGPVVILAIVLIGWAWFSLRNKKSSSRSRSKSNKTVSSMSNRQFAEHWQRIEGMMSLPGLEQTKSAIIEADKLFDIALRQQGFRGDTMGERLKSARTYFKNNNALYQRIWESHKLRNSLAHEVGFDVPKAVGQTHLAQFKAGLQFLKVL